jgi:hypothetical protein
VRRPDETLSAAVHKVRNIAESIYTNGSGPAQGAAPGADQPAARGPQAAARGERGGQAAGAQPAANANAGELNPLANRVLINAIITFCRDDLAIGLNKKVLSDRALFVSSRGLYVLSLKSLWQLNKGRVLFPLSL